MGREKDVPERRARCDKFDGDQGSLLIHLRRANDFAFDLSVGGGILYCDFGTFADAFLQNDHSSAGADGMRVTRQHFAGYVNDHGHAHQDALRASTFLGRGRASGRTRGGMRNCRP